MGNVSLFQFQIVSIFPLPFYLTVLLNKLRVDLGTLFPFKHVNCFWRGYIVHNWTVANCWVHQPSSWDTSPPTWLWVFLVDEIKDFCRLPSFISTLRLTVQLDLDWVPDSLPFEVQYSSSCTLCADNIIFLGANLEKSSPNPPFLFFFFEKAQYTMWLYKRIVLLITQFI